LPMPIDKLFPRSHIPISRDWGYCLFHPKHDWKCLQTPWGISCLNNRILLAVQFFSKIPTTLFCHHEWYPIVCHHRHCEFLWKRILSASFDNLSGNTV
jgi:hypothetical protein